jgi:hypothetical protein
MVFRLDMVDWIRCDESLPLAILSACPQYLVKGSDWRGKLPQDVLDACQLAETEIIYTDTPSRSSSERLHELYR